MIAPPPPNGRPRLVVVSGLSGAGKQSVLRALEDLGYEAVDNPPLRMVETLIGAERPLAVGIDARTRDFSAAEIVQTIQTLREAGATQTELVFAVASREVLHRRFTETRRGHPLAVEGSVTDGIDIEQAMTRPLRDAADWVIDTSDLPLAALRQMIAQRYSAERQTMSIALVSFAYPAGIPRQADVVFDARFLRNPHYIPDLRPQTGLDAPVRAYIEADPDYEEFRDRLIGLVDFLIPRFVREGKKYAMIAVGCTGGRHRSVTLIEALAASMRHGALIVQVEHRALRALATAVRNEPEDRTTNDKSTNEESGPAQAGPRRSYLMSGAVR